MKNTLAFWPCSIFMAFLYLLLSGLIFDVFADRGSLKLDGSSYASSADNEALGMGSNSFAMEAWIKHDGNSGENAVIISKRDGNLVDYELSLFGSGEEVTVRFLIYSTVYHATSESGIPPGRWTHIAGSYNGTSMSVYINGKLEGSRSVSGNSRANNEDLVIGADYTKNDRFFSGEIDEVRIWSQARTVTEINDNLFNALSGNESNLAANYSFSGNSNDSAGGNDLALHLNAEIIETGIFPVPPDLFALPVNAGARLLWHNRENAISSNTYKIYRSSVSDYADRTLIATIASGNDEYFDGELSNGTTYYYQITSINENSEESDFSYSVAVTPYATGGGGSLALDGSSHARASDRASLNLVKPPFTVEAWIKHDGLSQENAVILTKRDGNLIDYELRLEGSGEETALGFYIYSTSYSAVSSHGIPYGEWTHVAGIHNGTNLMVYINGELSGMRETSFDSRINNAPLIVGANHTGTGQFYSGQTDEIRIWDRAFTQDELRQQMTKQLFGNEEHLRACYRFDDVGVQTAYRSSMPGTLEFVGNASIVASGAYPVPPKIYGKLSDQQSFLQWTGRFDTNADEYVIYRSTSFSGNDRQSIESFNANQTSYIDTDVSLSHKYFYEVTSIVDGQESDFSYPASVTVSDNPMGNALSLGGLGYARATDRPSLDMGSQSLTIEAWINYDASSDDNAIILDKSVGSQIDYRLELTGSGDARTPRFYIYSTAYSATATEPIPPGEWVHLAGVYDSGNINIYVNGELAGTRLTSGNTRANNGDLVIGANATGNGNFFVGLIDEVRIWSSGKSMFEIRDRHRDLLMGNEEYLATYFRFDELHGKTTYASDHSPKTAILLGDATFAASGIPVSAESGSIEIPAVFTLSGNYPNPFNPITTIRYGLPEKTDITITVYDALGRRVAVLANGSTHPAGWHTVTFNAHNLSSGLYLYRLQAANVVLTGKMALVK